jgi:hypothetical protein
MNALLAAASEVQDHLRQADGRFCFIGGLALQRWGEPRFTLDIDLTLLCPYGAEPAAVEPLLAAFAPRIPDAREFASRNRVLLLRTAAGVPVDIALGAIPFEERCVARATEFDFGGVRLLTCSAEDLVVLKAFAGRDRDWADIGAIIQRQRGALNWRLIFEELEPLARVHPQGNAAERLRQMQQQG